MIGKLLGSVAKTALPLAGTAMGGPIGGMVGKLAGEVLGKALSGGKAGGASASGGGAGGGDPLNLLKDVFQAAPIKPPVNLLG